MNSNATARQKRLYLTGIAVLALGLASAALIYLTAAEVPPDAVGYIVVEGVVQPIAPGESKTYVRELERFGGKQAVLFDEFGRWFAGLWRGKALAVTIAWISVLVSLGVLLFARDMPNHPGSQD